MLTASQEDRVKVWQPRSKVGLVIGAWTLIAVFFSSRQILLVATNENPPAWGTTFFLSLADGYLWAAFTPLVVWVAKRLPFDRSDWWRALPLQVGSWFLIAATHITLYTPLVWMTMPDYKQARNTYRQFLSQIFNGSLHEGVLVCFGIVLVSRLLDTYRRYQLSEAHAAQLKAQLTDAQLQALKMQLHPHFLFNTLHAISTLIYKDPEAADQMLARLSEFLRLTLENSGTQEVTLRREMEFLNRYLAIEQMRFPDRLAITFDIAPDTLDAMVPNLVLQPLAENAVRHGIAPREEGGTIDIRAVRKQSTLTITVCDDGQGMNAERPSDAREGVGLRNTRARLQQLYGASYRMVASSREDGSGFAVHLILPFHTQQEGGE